MGHPLKTKALLWFVSVDGTFSIAMFDYQRLPQISQIGKLQYDQNQIQKPDGDKICFQYLPIRHLPNDFPKESDSFTTTLTKCAGPVAPNFDNNLPQQRRWDVFTHTQIFYVWPEAWTQGIETIHVPQNPETSRRSLGWFVANLAHGIYPSLQRFPDSPFNRLVKVWKGWSIRKQKNNETRWGTGLVVS